MRIPLVDLSNAGHRDRLLAPGSLPCERSRTFICPVATGAMAEAKGTALPIRAPLSLLRSAGILRGALRVLQRSKRFSHLMKFAQRRVQPVRMRVICGFLLRIALAPAPGCAMNRAAMTPRQ